MKPLREFLDPLADQLNPDGTVAPDIDEEYLWSKDKVQKVYRDVVVRNIYIEYAECIFNMLMN